MAVVAILRLLRVPTWTAEANAEMTSNVPNYQLHEHPTVSVVTAHGRQRLRSEGDDRLIDVLKRNGVPWSGVSTFAVSKFTGATILYPCLSASLSTLEDVSEILVYFNRNVNPFVFSFDQFQTVEAADAAIEATEYFYQRLDNTRAESELYLKKLSSQECQSVVAERVAEAVRDTVPPSTDLVVGVSGGGDSNALLHGLSRVTNHGLVVHGLIIKGIPEWNLGVPRIRELCDYYGVELKVMEEPEVKDLLRIPRSSGSLIDSFQREFKGDDWEFLGTLLIRLALSQHARNLNTSYICTGLNLEDLLCESIYRISTGLRPAPFPSRTIGDITLVFPLWLCPKKIIDGCFPRFSLDNYDARYPCFSLGRNLYYSVVYSIQSQFPGFSEQLVRGLSRLSLTDSVKYTLDEELGFHVERSVPLPLLHKFKRMIGAHHSA